MPKIECGPALPVGAVDSRVLRAAAKGSARSETQTPTAPGVVTSDVLDPGAPPIDSDRVELIRKAVESGTYPVVPTKVADAIIAAGILLRTPK